MLDIQSSRIAMDGEIDGELQLRMNELENVCGGLESLY